MELDTLFRDTRTVPGPTTEALDDGRAALGRATAAATRRVATVRRSKRRRRHRAGVLALVGAAATAALVVGPTLDLGGEMPADSAAAQVMLTAAAAAGAQPDLVSDAPYWYSRSEQSSGGVTSQREIWLGRTEVSVLVQTDPTTGEESVVGVPVYSFALGDRMLSWEELAALPTEVDELRAHLVTGVNPYSSRSEADQLFGMVMDILAESPAPPALRQALWELAATLPGVDVVEGEVDAAGRPGILLVLDGVEHTGMDGWSYLVDPDDGRLLEGRSTPSTVAPPEDADGNPVGEATTIPAGRTTYLESGPADTAPTPPPPPPGCPEDYRGC